MKRRGDPSDRPPIPEWVVDRSPYVDDERRYRQHAARVERWRVEHGYHKLEILIAQRDADRVRLAEETAAFNALPPEEQRRLLAEEEYQDA